MQPAEQPPEPENEANEINDTEGEQAETPPLFEFPPDLVKPPQSPSNEQEAGAAPPDMPVEVNQEAFEQAVRQGLIYPPPPSYYQNMSQVQVEERPAPFPPAGSAAGRAQPQPFVAPQLVRPPYPPPARPQPPTTQKRSRKWLWIVISVLAVAVLASCGLCGWGFYSIFNTAYQSTSGSLQVVNDFYTNLQSQRYQAAYNDLDMPQLTLAQFIQQAQQADQQKGTIQSYTPQQPSFGLNSNNGPDLSHFSFVVNVTRTHTSSYTVLLTVTQEGKTWKITDFDRL